MKHAVRTFNRHGECLHEAHFQTAEAAYEEYVSDIRLLKKSLKKGDEITVARYNDGDLMTYETVKG